MSKTWANPFEMTSPFGTVRMRLDLGIHDIRGPKLSLLVLLSLVPLTL